MSRETARYTRDGSSRAGGSVVYDEDLFMHTHSDNSPARGQVNAWDLVRLEKFSELDKDCDPSTPVSKRPSQLAMIKLAESLPEILASRAREELTEAVEEDPFEIKPAKPASPFRVLEASEFAGGEHIEPEWQVHELVPKVGSGLDVGESKTWKSFKVLDLATCIHRGTPYRGRPVQKGRSVIIVGEGVHGYPLRMKALAKHLGCNISELPAIIPAAPNLFQPQQIAELIAQLKILGATYVAIDTKFRCSLGAEENSAKDTAIVFGSMEEIARQVGCFVTAISHVGKDPSKGVRGSSSQFAAVDVEVTHERVGDLGTSTVTKLKEAQDGVVFTVKMLPVELGVSRKTGKSYGSLVVEHVDDPGAKTVKLPKPGSKARIALDAIKALIAKSGPVDPDTARAAVAATKLAPAPGERDRRTQRATEEIESLARQGLLFLVAGKLSDTHVVRGTSDEDF